MRLSSISPKPIHSIDPWTSCSRFRSKRVKHRCNYGVLGVQNIFDKSKIFWLWPNLIWTYTCKDRWKLVAANRWATTVKHRCNYGVLQNILDLIKIFWFWAKPVLDLYLQEYVTVGTITLPVKMFGMGQKVSSRLASSKFWPILAYL